MTDMTDMTDITGLVLPGRTSKPRATGLTMVIDNGLPTAAFIDAVTSNAELIDVVKFGWGTAMVTRDLERKIAAAHDNGIRFSFGGTLFEKFASQGRLRAYLDMCHRYGADMVEVSNGTLDMSNAAKAAYIRQCAEEFPVVSEVGSKDNDRADAFTSSMWIAAIGEDLAAGARMVITEARESGSSGICDANGDLRFSVIEDILAAAIDPSDLLFEAPTKSLQTWFVTRIGANVNLGNVAPADVIGVETIRLGLRSDTFHNYDTPFARPVSRAREHARVA
jgi:phosphosulfolactate synthase